MPILVTTTDFDLAEEYKKLREHAREKAGAIVQFVGLVRDFNESAVVQTLELQHYPGMTESVIDEICKEAQTRWQIVEPTVIHRVGKLQPGDQIVLVSVASDHRADAFAACEFIMDQLKTKATFWKNERRAEDNNESKRWLEMKASDRQRAERWDS